MEDSEEMAWTRLNQPPAPPRRGRRWLLIGSLAFAFMLALGVGAIMAASSSTAQASDLTSSGTSSSQTLAVAPGNANNSQTFAAGPGAQGNCEAVTVTSVNGSTIVAKTASGSSVTIHTTASTRYTQAGNTVAASAIKVGTRIHIMGTHNSDGSITATSIDVG